jgi:hypothetical protein
MIQSLLQTLLCLSFAAPGYFKENYTQSRTDFNRFSPDWAQGKLTHFTAFKVPSENDPDLTVDALLLGKQSDTELLVIIGGIHGPETFAASAIQHFFLHEKAESFVKKNVSILLVHAMNPYGFKYGRRVTESNVDLNRNFFIPASDFKSYPDLNPSFRQMRNYLEPQAPADSILESFLHLSKGMVGELVFGKLSRKEINNAVAGGQFEFPQAVFYGGQKLEPQSEWLRDLLRQIFVGKNRVLILDLHTGLGDRGTLHLITVDSEKHVSETMGPAFFKNLLARQDLKLTTASTPGFYKTHGDLLDFGHHLTKPGQKYLGLTLEYGTEGSGMVAQLRSLNRMILENQGFQHGYTTPRIEKEIKKSFRDLFYPQEESWKAQVMEKADLFFQELLLAYP